MNRTSSSRLNLCPARLALYLASLLCGALPASAQQGTVARGTRLDYGIDVFGVRILRPGPAFAGGPPMTVEATGSIQGQGDLRAELRPFGSQTSWFVRGRLSNLQRNRFYGWGNATEVSSSAPYHRLEQALGEVAFGFDHSIGSGMTLSVGPLFRWRFTDPELEASPDPAEQPTIVSTMQPLGVGAFRQVGLTGSLVLDRTGTPVPTALANGVRLEVEGTYFPGLADQPGAMVSTSVQAAASRNLGLGANLSVRAGLEKRWGQFPFMDAAFLGGRRSLRGFQKQRFAGDAAAWLATDLHLPGAKVSLAGRQMRIGPLATLDVGRVSLDGQSAGGWHLGQGLGLWAIDGTSGRYVSAALSWGDGSPRAYLNVGVPLSR